MADRSTTRRTTLADVAAATGRRRQTRLAGTTPTPTRESVAAMKTATTKASGGHGE